MKYLTLFAILITIAGCSIKSNSSFTVEQINECIAENQQNGLDGSVEVCRNRCNNDVPCEQRVAVIAKEKFGYEEDSPLTSGGSGVAGDMQDEEIEKSTTLTEPETPQPPLSGGLPTEPVEPTKTQDQEIENESAEDEIGDDEDEVGEKTDTQESQDGLVSLAGFSCEDKEGLPDRMKIFVERVDIKKWNWMIPHGGVWEFTDLEPGQYKIYYAAERNTEPLAKYSELMADGSGSHDYKILDLTSGGEVKDIKPCDWE
jgi:hypothetical protein